MNQLPGLQFEPFGGLPSSYRSQVASRKFLVSQFASCLGELERGGLSPLCPLSDAALHQHAGPARRAFSTPRHLQCAISFSNA